MSPSDIEQFIPFWTACLWWCNSSFCQKPPLYFRWYAWASTVALAVFFCFIYVLVLCIPLWIEMILRMPIVLISKVVLLEYIMLLLLEIIRYHSKRKLQIFVFKSQERQAVLWSQRVGEGGDKIKKQYWIKSVQLLTRFLIYPGVTLHISGNCVLTLFNHIFLILQFSWIPATGKLLKSSESALSIPVTPAFMLGDQMMGK